MKKIFTLVLILTSLYGYSQRYLGPLLYGEIKNRVKIDSVLRIPIGLTGSNNGLRNSTGLPAVPQGYDTAQLRYDIADSTIKWWTGFQWRAPGVSGGGGSGTVTSVGISLPAEFSITGSPVTSAGTITGAWVNQSANRVFAGPSSGGPAAPGFRTLLINDIPMPPNIGSGYRIYSPQVPGFKTLFGSNTLVFDSTTNSNALTLNADTSVLATQYDISNNWSIYGNNNTNSANNYIGVNNNVPFNIRVNGKRTFWNSILSDETVLDSLRGQSLYWGVEAGRYDTINGNVNIGIGTYALRNYPSVLIPPPGANIAIGHMALHNYTGGNSEANVAIGFRSMARNISGYRNVGVGVNTLHGLSTGDRNNAFGSFALEYNTTGQFNSAGGEGTLRTNTIGSANSAWGNNALFANSGAVRSITVTNGGSGYTSAPTVTIGPPVTPPFGYNLTVQATATAVITGDVVTSVIVTEKGLGYNLNPSVTFSGGGGSGATATADVVAGNFNTAIGNSSMDNNVWGYANTSVGVYSGDYGQFDSLTTNIGYLSGRAVTVPSTTPLTKSTAIGYNAKYTVSNALVLGGTGADQPNVGIGLTNPDTRLHTLGPVKMQIDNLDHNILIIDTLTGADKIASLLIESKSGYNIGSILMTRSYDTYQASGTLYRGGAFLAPNIARGQSSAISLGKNLAQNNNDFLIGYTHFSDGNDSNKLDISAWGTGYVMSMNARKQVSIGAEHAHASAALDINSNSRGFLTTRLTSNQRTNIASPATSLFTWDTDSARYMGYDGSSWKSIAWRTDIGSSGGGSNHNILSSTHTDATPGTVARGDLITGQGASPTWTRLGLGSINQILQSNGTDLGYVTIGGDVTLSGGTATIPSGSVLLNELGAANGSNNINNGSNTQIWRWDALGGGDGLTLSATSTASLSGQTVLNVFADGVISAASQTTYGARITNNHTGTTETNVALRAEATNGTNNYAIIVPSGGGRVGIGTSLPSNTLHVIGSTNFTGGNSTIDVTGYSLKLVGVGSDNTAASLYGVDGSGNVVLRTVASLPGGGTGHTIRDEGTNLTARTGLNFIGSAVTAADDAGGDETEITFDAEVNGIADLSANGIVARTGSGTFAGRTITGTTNQIVVTDGNGVSGNPVINVGSDIVQIDLANTYNAGSKQSFDADATSADIRLIGHTADPSTLSAGDMWYNSANNVFMGRFNTTSRQFATLNGLETLTNKTITSSSNVIGGVTMTLGSDGEWDLYTRNASGVLERISNGTTGQFLGANTGAKPTWQSPSGGGGAPTDAQYLVSTLNGTLSAERLLTAGVNTKLTDGGANGNLTVDVGSDDFRLPGDISPAQLTADQNDWAPTGHATSSTIRFSTDAARNITGMAGGADGVIRILHNIGSFNATIVNESTSSAAANRFAFGSDLTIGPGQSITVRYDATSSRWRGEDNNGIAVAITSPQNQDILVYNSATGIFENTRGKNYRNANTKTSNTTLTLTEDVIFANGGTTAFTITLPAASGNAGKKYSVICSGAQGATVTIDANASETINGLLTVKLEHAYTGWELVCDGSNWFAEYIDLDNNYQSTVVLRDDFFEGAEIGEVGELGWNIVGVGTETFPQIDGESGRPGITRLGSGAVSGDDCDMFLGGSATSGALNPLLPNNNFDVTYIVRIPTITTMNCQIGLAQVALDASYASNHFVGFLFDPAISPKWRMRTRASANTDNISTDADVAASTWYKLRMVRNGSSILFYINDVFQFNHTTNLPTNALSPYVGVNTQTAAARNLDIDYFYLKANVVR